MVDVLTLEVGEVRLTRVPYFDVALDPSAVGLSAKLVAEAGWAVPTWATEGGQGWAKRSGSSSLPVG